MLTFTTADISRALGEATYEKGREYQRMGNARLIAGDLDSSSVRGEVQGSRRAAYKVSVQMGRALRGGPEGQGFPVFVTRCTCPLGGDCKHVAALLLQILAKQEGGAHSEASPVSGELANWLAEIERAASSGEDEYPSDIKQRLFYLLSVAPDHHGGPRFKVRVVVTQLLKDGSFSGPQTRDYDPATPFNGSAKAKFLRAADLPILSGLHHFGLQISFAGRDGRFLRGAEGADLLARMLATGRCRWQTLDGPILSAGAARPAAIRWTAGGDGRQRPEIAVEDGVIAGILGPPWYVDHDKGVCGPLDVGMPPLVASTFLSAPPLTPVEAAAVRPRLAASLAPSSAGAAASPGRKAALPLPAEMPPPRQVGGKPVPRLRLFRRRLRPVPYRSSYRWGLRDIPPGKESDVEVAVADLSFLYGGVELQGDETRPRPMLMIDGALVEITRRPKDERAAAADLKEIGFAPVSSLHIWQVPADSGWLATLSRGDPPADEDAWYDFLVHLLPALRENGWLIDVAEDFPYRLAAPDSDIDAELTEGSGIDWFELHLGVSVDGARIDILPALLRALRLLPVDGLGAFLEDASNDATSMKVKLDDGRILPLLFGRIRPILKALAGLFDGAADGDGRVILRPADAVDLVDFEETAGLRWTGGEGLRALGQRLKTGVGLPDIAPPPSFTGILRPYQQAGLAWLQLLREIGLGGVLADDMGLGKTVQLLAHLSVEKAAGRLDRPCLVIAPTSLMPNWRAEAAAFAPELSVLVQHGAERKDSFNAIAHHDLVLTTYALLARDVDILAARDWHMVIADEAQFVKNPATAASKALRRLQARHRLAMTGTPLENHLGELWALFDFVSPGFLGDARGFGKSWRTPIEKRGDRERQKQLARRVRPFLLRRTKAEVAADLPPKTEIVEQVALGDQQRDLYDGIRLAMHKKLRDAIAAKGLRRSRIELLDALLKLRQACCDPRLVRTAPGAASRSGAGKAGSAKLERLMEMLPELIDEGRRILLFSQFTSMLDLIQAELAKSQIPFVILTGETTDRATPVRRFQRGEVPLFLISLRAGGTGLNLTAADTVIHYDPWWNPAVEAQATDRAHRIGQNKPVFVHKLMALDTIEVKMGELKARKQSLADGLFDPEAGGALDISEDDVEFLLGEGL
jgi:superfamily II DNA or RNA helicase